MTQPALVLAAMVLPAPLLRPALVLTLAFTRLPTVFLTAVTTPAPFGSLNG